MPASTFVMGSACPMMPFEEGSTSIASQLATCAASAHIRLASFSPCFPVQALAFPAFTTIALRRPSATCSRPTLTGAAKTLLVVKAAAADARRSQTKSPTSGACLVLIPAKTPVARNPPGESKCKSAIPSLQSKRRFTTEARRHGGPVLLEQGPRRGTLLTEDK